MNVMLKRLKLRFKRKKSKPLGTAVFYKGKTLSVEAFAALKDLERELKARGLTTDSIDLYIGSSSSRCRREPAYRRSQHHGNNIPEGKKMGFPEERKGK